MDHPCVDTVTCTLSKLFPISGFNQGFKFSRTKNITHYQELYSANRFGVRILCDIMKKFPANHIVKKYKDKQTFWCNKLNLQSSYCVYHAELTEDLLWYCENKRLAIDFPALIDINAAQITAPSAPIKAPNWTELIIPNE